MNEEKRKSSLAGELARCEEKLKRSNVISLSAIGASALSLIVAIGVFSTMRTYYLVDDYGGVVKLRKTGEPEITRPALYNFAEETVSILFNVNYKNYENKLSLVSNRFLDKSYDDLVKELHRSNFIAVLKKFHRDVNVVPTSTVYKIEPVAKNVFDVYRSFAMEIVGDDGVKTSEIVFVVRVGKVKRSDRYYHGLAVIGVKQLPVEEFKKRMSTP